MSGDRQIPWRPHLSGGQEWYEPSRRTPDRVTLGIGKPKVACGTGPTRRARCQGMSWAYPKTCQAIFTVAVLSAVSQIVNWFFVASTATRWTVVRPPA